MSDTKPAFGDRVQGFIFNNRAVFLILFALITLVMGFAASLLKVDAGFDKRLPISHPYMETFREYRDEFGGANRILVSVRAVDGDMFTPAFFTTLQQVTDEVFNIPGVDPARVTSIFTPNVRFIEIVEDGFAGGNVIPADFKPTPEFLNIVRENILKSGQVGRLVATDFSAAVVSANLVDRDPQTGEPIDYIAVGQELERALRDKYQTDDINIDIIGYAKVVADVADGAAGVALFFLLAFAISALLVYLYSKCIRATSMLLICSVAAVVWQLGLLTMLGYGIDPLSILVPFLVFAIAVSHGMQMINAVGAAMMNGATTREAAESSFRRLLVPGSVALLSDTIGFLTILLIDIPMIKELAIAASIGVAVIIITNLLILPLLMSYVTPGPGYRDRIVRAAMWKRPIWHKLSYVATPKIGGIVLVIAALLFAIGWQGSQSLQIGDLQAGVPELRPDSRYNIDTDEIIERYTIGVDLLQVIVEAPADGCIDYGVMSALDRFEWAMRNVDGVQSTISLASVMKVVNAGWNEGHPAWQTLSRNSQVLVRAVRPVETSTGLLNAQCSVMPVLIFTEDHKATTINRIIDSINTYVDEHSDDPLTYRLATGNVGIMAATNDVVEAAQGPILLYVYIAIIALCLVLFRSLRATLCTVLPLTLVSVLCYTLMAQLGIGLKVSTLPVAALGVGIGVDYGIYIFTRLLHYMRNGEPLREAYEYTLRETGSAVVFTGVTLALGVTTWVLSALQFQADMGLLLAFMFLVNMLGAILVLPAIAAMIYPREGLSKQEKPVTAPASAE
ncbi:MAG TPA: RND transporter [Rhodospirillaceae bacterium]|nr:RND transporter [Alphaproteobacteria bacterium]MAS48974.1 RND transporter [Alphaproteobacteria bacterium]MBN52638.1 RND transporter [Alphaproteobacteria bacterium]OUT39583.1 MAG: RND transporter [Micavibrio sp. TMED2]HCI46097.1 RND transporter [Rhodospirillaceae bacterium]|tara:strand:+ start:21355 stop:23724 length:2370 start_codon:yes stop_codon:yes gene_type:complete